MPPADLSKLFCNQLRVQRSLKSHGKAATGITIFDNPLPFRSTNFISKGPKTFQKSTDMLSFEQEHYSLVSVKQSAQWKVAGDTGEHILYIVDTSGCTPEKFGAGVGGVGNKSCLPKKIPTTNTSQMM